MDGFIFVGTNFCRLNKNVTFIGFKIRGHDVFFHNSYGILLFRGYWNSWIVPSTKTTKIGTPQNLSHPQYVPTKSEASWTNYSGVIRYTKCGRLTHRYTNQQTDTWTDQHNGHTSRPKCKAIYSPHSSKGEYKFSLSSKLFLSPSLPSTLTFREAADDVHQVFR